MVELSKCKACNFKEFSYDCEDTEDPSKVAKIFCLVCKEFYADNKHELQKLKGKVKDVVRGWIEGSTIVKKCNAEAQLKSNVHTLALAVHRLKEKAKSLSATGTPGEPLAQESSGSTQTSIVKHAANATREQRKQLVTKFELCHFLTVKSKSFQFCQDMVRFGKDVHKVVVGTGYLNRQSGTETICYLSKVIVMENITEPLNKGE